MKDFEYDNATKLILMGVVCHVADEVYPARVEKVADEIMEIMSRRKKPNKLWSVKPILTPSKTEPPATD